MDDSYHQIFINYRRNDTADVATRLYETLTLHFGAGRIFMDVDDVSLGDDFRRAIEEAIEQSTVVLALIGQSWGRSFHHVRQVDHVRLELEQALAQDKRIVPVLVDGALMPSDAALPVSIAEIPYRNALDLSQAEWQTSSRRLSLGIQNASYGMNQQSHIDPSDTEVKFEVLARRSEPQIRLDVAHQTKNARLLLTLAQDSDSTVRAAAVDRIFDESDLHHLMTATSNETRASAIRRLRFLGISIDRYADDATVAVRKTVAEVSVNADSLLVLSTDAHSDVRRVALSKVDDADFVARLTLDEDDQVRSDAARRLVQLVDASLLESSSINEVRAAVAADSQDPDLLRRLMQDDSGLVRAVAASNPSSDSITVASLQRDPNGMVVAAVGHHFCDNFSFVQRFDRWSPPFYVGVANSTTCRDTAFLAWLREPSARRQIERRFPDLKDNMNLITTAELLKFGIVVAPAAMAFLALPVWILFWMFGWPFRWTYLGIFVVSESLMVATFLRLLWELGSGSVRQGRILLSSFSFSWIEEIDDLLQQRRRDS